MDENCKELIESLKRIFINEFAYWNDCRPTFELIYTYKKDKKNGIWIHENKDGFLYLV